MNNIRKLRENAGIDQKQLAVKVGVTQPTVSDWENGRKKPSSESAAKLADYFGVSIDCIMGRDSVKPKSRAVRIPVLGRVAAGIPIDAIEFIEDWEEIDADTAADGEYFGLRIRGSSMEPRIADGDVVIVRRQEDVESGEIAIVLINGDEATCKKVIKSTGGIMLLSNNPAFEPMFYTSRQVAQFPISIIGKVVELRGKM